MATANECHSLCSDRRLAGTKETDKVGAKRAKIMTKLLNGDLETVFGSLPPHGPDHGSVAGSTRYGWAKKGSLSVP